LVAADLNGLGIVTKNGKQYSLGATYCGQTTGVTNGFIKDGAIGYGYFAAKAKCEVVSDCGMSLSAHMCTGEELIRSQALGMTIARGWYSNGTYDCSGWTTTINISNSPGGSVWSGVPNTDSCSNANAILCCDRIYQSGFYRSAPGTQAFAQKACTARDGPMTKRILRALGSACFVTLGATTSFRSGPAHAMYRHERSLTLRKQSALVEARDESAKCAAAGCPEQIRTTCTQRISEIASVMPGVVWPGEPKADAAPQSVSRFRQVPRRQGQCD